MGPQGHQQWARVESFVVNALWAQGDHWDLFRLIERLLEEVVNCEFICGDCNKAHLDCSVQSLIDCIKFFLYFIHKIMK